MWVSSNSHSTAATVHAFVMDDPSVICVLHPVVKEGAVVAERGEFSLQGMGWDIVGGCDGEGANHVTEVHFLADTGEAHGREAILIAVMHQQRDANSHLSDFHHMGWTPPASGPSMLTQRPGRGVHHMQIGRAACRERVGQSV